MALRRSLVLLMRRTMMLLDPKVLSKLPTPTPPPGTGVVFHARMQAIKYSIENPRWYCLLISGSLGVYSGNWVFKEFVMRKNPPNPRPDPTQRPPQRHPHTVLEEDEEDDDDDE
ncbi:unnamed protein product [Vitrella brassicaformis CCMP3155]|uniref:Uncharacterized protein n=2 Tax=Vitrella brassicaformis TaxID=1169539 RepID=A0A0G4EPT5_VITBC|nr:unnamed protein product [Vitrella brassicaformis CCMP3155]|mmetsp:Transcript_34700/g.86056  ORF Transcript_34700/g.86056 Transcript_34700/m.86056 type:complete len:114 (+) Transcript_34700:49-390(+)|eukprot:CEL99451.1 unnamed protein product [Vitrella brassicaformis CCMP3155]